MIQIANRIILLFALMVGVSFGSSAAAATASFSFEGNFEYTAQTGEFYLAGADMSLLSHWDITAPFWQTNTPGHFTAPHELRIENQVQPLPLNLFNLGHQPEASQMITLLVVGQGPDGAMNGPITLSGIPLTGSAIDMTQNYSGTFSSDLIANSVATPVPASLSILGFGLILLAGIRRSSH